jgi:hypothetical protein
LPETSSILAVFDILYRGEVGLAPLILRLFCGMEVDDVTRGDEMTRGRNDRRRNDRDEMTGDEMKGDES